ncbi:MAG TPA: DUF1272 domain-containing protein [Stellaceae bacterium]|nr:DUF1272 domain-containing protein [Stellaceae bacterium]
MLELRPNCEYCDKDLPPDAADARICTYECTFCAECVETHLDNVCPNCGGGFEKRPIRPKTERRPGVSLGRQPASAKRRRLKYDPADTAAFSAQVKDIPPAER